MANYCWNWVQIEGSKKSIETVVSRMKDYDNFDNLTDWGNHIIGSEVFDKDASVYDNIGTRWWDIQWDQDISKSDSEDLHYITFVGDSAWSPPTHLLEEIAKTFSLEIRIEFEEPGMSFGGYCEYNKDGLIEDYTVEYNQWVYEQDPNAFFERFQEDLEDGVYNDYTVKDINKDYPFLSEEHREYIIKTLIEWNTYWTVNE